MSNLKLHKTQAMDNTFIQEKLLSRLTFNPGLTLTGFWTTRPRAVNSQLPNVLDRSLFRSLWIETLKLLLQWRKRKVFWNKTWTFLSQNILKRLVLLSFAHCVWFLGRRHQLPSQCNTSNATLKSRAQKIEDSSKFKHFFAPNASNNK